LWQESNLLRLESEWDKVSTQDSLEAGTMPVKIRVAQILPLSIIVLSRASELNTDRRNMKIQVRCLVQKQYTF